MKIIGIQSSPRGKASNTRKLLNAAAEGAREAGAEVEIVDVTKLNIGFCRGDVSCYRTGACFQDDDYAALKDKIVAADGVILSAPNYIDNLPAQLKVVFDRSANFIHEQLLDGKYGCCIATSGSANFGFVLKGMEEFLRKSGGLKTGELAVAMAHGPAAMEDGVSKAREMGRDLVTAIREKRAYSEQVAAHREWKELFARTVAFNKDHWKHNYDYWVAKGWIRP
jgi:multimeric flavodoxin WrbA